MILPSFGLKISERKIDDVLARIETASPRRRDIVESRTSLDDMKKSSCF